MRPGPSKIKLLLAVAIAAFTMSAATSSASAATETFRWFPAKGAEKGVMIVLPGGGWYGGFGSQVHDGAIPKITGLYPGFADEFTSEGWRVLSVAYRGGAPSIIDVREAYSMARARATARRPVCVRGLSAGGHLALMLAMEQPKLDCVIAEGAPTDLVNGNWQLDPPPNNTAMANAVAGSFGTNTAVLKWWSPAYRVSTAKVGARILIAASKQDPVVPLTHLRYFVAAAKLAGVNVTSMILDSGSAVPFVHRDVTRVAYNTYSTLEDNLTRTTVRAKAAAFADHRSKVRCHKRKRKKHCPH